MSNDRMIVCTPERVPDYRSTWRYAREQLTLLSQQATTWQCGRDVVATMVSAVGGGLFSILVDWIMAPTEIRCR